MSSRDPHPANITQPDGSRGVEQELELDITEPDGLLSVAREPAVAPRDAEIRLVGNELVAEGKIPVPWLPDVADPAMRELLSNIRGKVIPDPSVMRTTDGDLAASYSATSSIPAAQQEPRVEERVVLECTGESLAPSVAPVVPSVTPPAEPLSYDSVTTVIPAPVATRRRPLALFVLVTIAFVTATAAISVAVTLKPRHAVEPLERPTSAEMAPPVCPTSSALPQVVAPELLMPWRRRRRS